MSLPFARFAGNGAMDRCFRQALARQGPKPSALQGAQQRVAADPATHACRLARWRWRASRPNTASAVRGSGRGHLAVTLCVHG